MSSPDASNCLVVITESAADDLRRLGDLSRELGCDVQVITATLDGDNTAEVEVDDWHAVLARSRRIDTAAVSDLERTLASLQPHADELARAGNGRPLVFLGEAAVLGALSLTGSYAAITTAAEPSDMELLGLHHADALAAISLAALTSLGDHELFASAVVPVPPADADEPGTPAPSASDDRLVIAEPDGLNSEVSFAVLEALVELNRSRRTDLVVGGKVDEQSATWAQNLGVRDRLIESGDPANAEVVLCTSSDPDALVRAAQWGEAQGVPTVSVFEHPLAAGPIGKPVPWGTTGADLAAALTTAATATTLPAVDVQASISGLGFQQVIGRAAELADEPGQAFRAVRQKLWELHYEGESADGYDDKYHAAACYVELDQELASLVGSCLPAAPAQRRILDLGCGPGSMIPFLLDLDDVEIVGVDISPAMLDHARDRFPSIPFELGATDAIPHNDDSFDVVLVSGVLHHLPSLRPTLEEISRVLTPTGWLVVREPNEDNMSHRNPDLALAHQCIRSLVLDRFGHRPVWEPEAHDDHTDFTPALLAESLATVFAVETVMTGGVISYFHDTLTPDQLPLVSEIESTLTGQPGLNLFIAARQADAHKRDDASISPGAADALGELDAPPPIRADHIDALLATAGDLLAGAGAPAPLGERVRAVMAALGDDAVVLDAGNHPLTADASARGGLEAGDPVADAVSVVLSTDPNADADVIEVAASRVRDHGWLVIDIPAGTSRSALRLDEESSALTCVGVEPMDTGGYRVAARRHALAPVDLITALENVLDRAATTIEPVSAERLAGWQQQVDRWRIEANWSWGPSSFARHQRLGDVLDTLTA